MSTIEATELLRGDLLQGVRILIAGAPHSALEGNSPSGEDDRQGATVAAVLERACGRLGARVRVCSPLAEDGEALQEDALAASVARALEELGGLELLVIDAGSLFACRAGEGARAALVGCMDATWSITQAVAGEAFIARGSAGRVLFLAPRAASEEAQAGYVGAVRAALENLARTLSIEWARYAITTVTLAPGASSSDGEIAAITAYLASPAGAYFSGCLFELGNAPSPTAG